MFRPAGFLVVVSGAAFVMGGCSSPPESSSLADVPKAGAARQAIVAGTTSGRTSVVLLVNPDARCTATMVAPNVVLTAVHCVGQRTQTVSTDGSQQVVTAYPSYKPGAIMIYAGKDAPERAHAGAAPAAIGAKIVAPSLFGYPDIALVVLSAKLDVPVAALRLEGLVARGESLVAAGFGKTENDVYTDVLLERAAVVTDVGPTKSDVGPVRFGEFTMGEATCYGDSGGPILSASGAVVGVISRGGNAGMEGVNGALDCIGPSHVSIVPSVAMVKDVIVETIRQAGSEPVVERDVALASSTVVSSPVAEAAPSDDPGAAPSDSAGGCSVSSPSQHIDDTTTAAAILASASVVLASLRRRVRGRLRR